MEQITPSDSTAPPSRFRMSILTQLRWRDDTSVAECFSGSDAVKWLVAAGEAGDTPDAIRQMQAWLDDGHFRPLYDDEPQTFEPSSDRWFCFSVGGFYTGISRQISESAASSTNGDVVALDLALEDEEDYATPLATPSAYLAQKALALGGTSQQRLRMPDNELALSLSPGDAHNARLVGYVRPPMWVNPKPRLKYHLVVVGGGSAGIAAALAGVAAGARVAIVEKVAMGGANLRSGSVPSKALLRAAHAAHMVKNKPALIEMGVLVSGEVKVDFSTVMARVRRLRADLAEVRSVAELSKMPGLDVYIGNARFVGHNSLSVDQSRIDFARCCLATGSSPRIPDISNLEQLLQEHRSGGQNSPAVLTTDDFFNLTTLPKRLVIIGCGPVGVELAQAMARLGSQVTVCGRRGRILHDVDVDIARVLQRKLEAEGVSFILDVRKYTNVTKLLTSPPGAASPELNVRLTMRDLRARNLRCDALLIAAGRTPNVRGMDLELGRISFSSKAGITVNARLQTTNHHVFAAGDCCTEKRYAHVAEHTARVAVKNALFFGQDKSSARNIPWTLFTQPELAHIGKSRADVGAKNAIDRPLGSTTRATLDSDRDGMIRLHLHPSSDRLSGATVLASRAGDMINELSLAAKVDVGLRTIASAMHVHPTSAEAICALGVDLHNEKLAPLQRAVLRHVLKLVA